MNVLILNGSPRPQGNTKKMINAFVEAANGDNHMYDGAKFSYDGDFVGYLRLESMGIYTNYDSDVINRIKTMARSL